MPDPIRVSDSAYSTIEHAWIPLSDGCRLAAKVWLPPDTDRQQVPAILEYIPYRKNDLTAARDAMMHGYFAAKGYASARVDIRGSGDSDGFLEDEYLPQEQADALEVIRWLGEQSWCDGHVGMIGISWGAFSALQVAALAPPELGAVISYSSTDDRYALDVHYNGGCLQSWDQMSWASTVLALSALPPDPAVRGGAWRSIWLERLGHAEPVIESWLSHQRRDGYWKHGSVAEDYDAIKCPVYMVGGWADAYRDAILRFLAGFSGPSKGLIGPWAHTYPYEGQPGPAIGFLQEAVRWWDHWSERVCRTGSWMSRVCRSGCRSRCHRMPATGTDRAAGLRKGVGLRRLFPSVRTRSVTGHWVRRRARRSRYVTRVLRHRQATSATGARGAGA